MSAARQLARPGAWAGRTARPRARVARRPRAEGAPRSEHTIPPAIVLGLILALGLVLLLGGIAGAAEPSLTPGFLQGGDPRSEGEGPGLVGSPLAILAGVVVLGLATAALTVAVIRVRQRP